MLSAAGGRTPEVWNFPYANPHHGSLVNGNGRESLAEEGELLAQRGCTQPAHNTAAALPPRHTVVPLASRLAAARGGPTSTPAGAITLESVRTWQ